MPDEKFALPVTSYKELSRLIVAYARLRTPATLDELSKVSGINSDSITRNNQFLIASGIITKTARKAATDLGKDLGRALEFGVADAISAAWKAVVDSHDVFHQFVDYVKNRGTVDADDLQSRICLISGVAKTPRTLRGALTVIDILLTAGVIAEAEKNRYIAGSPQAAATEHVVVPEIEVTDRGLPEPPRRQTAASDAIDGSPPSLNVNIQVHISADATADQIEQIFSSMAKHLYHRK